MSSASKKSVQKLNLDRASGIRNIVPVKKPGEREREIAGIRLKEVFPYATEIAFESVDAAIKSAREKLGVVFSSEGQTIMFPELNDKEKEIPREKAEELTKFLQGKLAPKNIKVDHSGDTITLTMGPSDDPAEDQGYRRK